MRVVCAWCQHDSRPSLLREVEPLDDPTETHGICDAHHAEAMRQLLASAVMPSAPLATALPGPGAGEVLSALLQLRAWVQTTPASVAAALARVVEEIERLETLGRALEIEGAHLSSEVARLHGEVERLRREHDELASWHRQATWVASTLLDQVLERTLQPLHDVVARLRATSRPGDRRRMPSPSVDRRHDSF